MKASRGSCLCTVILWTGNFVAASYLAPSLVHSNELAEFLLSTRIPEARARPSPVMYAKPLPGQRGGKPQYRIESERPYLFYENQAQAEQHREVYEREGLSVGDSKFQVLPKAGSRKAVENEVKMLRYFGNSSSFVDFPDLGNLPEIAVWGRSNVGKSTLLNLITKNNAKAAVSKFAGTTRHVHHYLCLNKWWLKDVPGYGYARATAEEKERWDNATKAYFKSHEQLAAVMLLIEASLPPQEIDLEHIDWLVNNEVPFLIVLTKYDYHKKDQPSPEQNHAALKEELQKKFKKLPTMIPTSSVPKSEFYEKGRNSLLDLFAKVIQFTREKTRLAKIERRYHTVATRDNSERRYSRTRTREVSRRSGRLSQPDRNRFAGIETDAPKRSGTRDQPNRNRFGDKLSSAERRELAGIGSEHSNGRGFR